MVLFSYTVVKSRAYRDRINAKVMKSSITRKLTPIKRKEQRNESCHSL
jgi:uncharacterized protein YbaA (DUF1428 family)